MARLIEHSTDERPAAPAPESPIRAWPLILAGPVAALGAFAVSAIIFALPVFALWLTAPEVSADWDTWPEVARIAGVAWLLGQGLPVVIADVAITLIPWGLVLISAGLLLLAGRWAARVSAVGRPIEAATVGLSAAVIYSGLALAVATWISDPMTGPGRVLATTFLLALIAGGLGALVGAGLVRQTVRRLPMPVRRIAAASSAAIALLVVAGGVAVTVSLLVHSTETQRLLTSLAPDAAGFVAIALISIGYLPTMVVWGVSYILGTGFTVAEGLIIGPFAAPATGELPLFPLLGALPQQTPPGAQALPLIGLLSGLLAALILKRRGSRGWILVGEAAASLAVAAGLLLLLLLAGSGALGAGRLVDLGPLIGPSLGVASLLWVVGCLIIVLPAVVSASVADDDDDRDWQSPAEGGEVIEIGQRHA